MLIPNRSHEVYRTYREDSCNGELIMGQRDDIDGRAFGPKLSKKAVEAEERARTFLVLQRIALTIGVSVEDFFNTKAHDKKINAAPNEENQD